MLTVKKTRHHHLRFQVWALLALFLIFISAPGNAESSVTIAAAANLSAVAPELTKAFQKTYPGIHLTFILGSAGNLVTQIVNGAPYDVFMSADMGFAQKLAKTGMTSGPIVPYAVGKLVLLTTQKLDLSQGLSVLIDPKVTQIANCNPQLAVYGRAAQQALKKLKLWGSLQGKILVAQDITQALQFTLQGADAGFVNLSALKTPALAKRFKEGVNWIEVDPKLYTQLVQGFVVIKTSADRESVKDFVTFLQSSQAIQIFANFGYDQP